MSSLLAPRSDVGEFRRRFKWLALAVLLAFGTVAGRLFQLQVVQGADYERIAHSNIIRRVALPTARGVLRDARGQVLASSRPSYNVYVVPGRVMPSARAATRRGRSLSGADDPDTLPRIADVLRLNPAERATTVMRIRNACAHSEIYRPWVLS